MNDTPTPLTDAHLEAKHRAKFYSNPDEPIPPERLKNVEADADFARSLERQIPRWLPIESAPRDGTRILAWSAEHGMRETYMQHYQQGSWGRAVFEAGAGPSECGWSWLEPQSGWSSSWRPTHWMPLPEPPQP